ncbi:hypothetical protein CKA32_003601 [Geitlerinema sp. FC II]|nr:hypothetical protein CKA32_003601 [Geitlerinema sp. FC II]
MFESSTSLSGSAEEVEALRFGFCIKRGSLCRESKVDIETR